MGIQADLLGAHALDIRNILAMTGDPPRTGDYANATAVFDVDGVGLIGILRRMNEGLDATGNSIGDPTAFCIGAALNPANRFKPIDFELDGDWLDLPEEERPLPQTQYLRDATQTIISHNDSPAAR